MAPAEHRDQLEVLEAQRPSAASEGDTETSQEVMLTYLHLHSTDAVTNVQHATLIGVTHTHTHTHFHML